MKRTRRIPGFWRREVSLPVSIALRYVCTEFDVVRFATQFRDTFQSPVRMTSPVPGVARGSAHGDSLKVLPINRQSVVDLDLGPDVSPGDVSVTVICMCTILFNLTMPSTSTQRAAIVFQLRHEKNYLPACRGRSSQTT